MALFYNQVRPVAAGTHADMRISPRQHYRFAASANAIPIGANEFRTAQAHYPIVFAGAADPAPVIVTGLREGENRFVDASGAWRHGSYVPGYVRRYPFGLARVAGKEEMVLAIDDTAEELAGDTGEPLFENGQPSNTTTRALKFCTAVEQQIAQAKLLSVALHGADLLVEARAELRRTAGTAPYRLGGFRVVDETRFDRLAEDVFLAWREKGWIALVYAHLMSLRHWAALAEGLPLDPA